METQPNPIPPKSPVAEFDERYLAVTFGDDMDFLGEVLETYVASAELLGVQLAEAIEVNDFETLRHIAHTLKGSSRMVGANHFADYCQEVETGSEDSMLDEARGVILKIPLVVAECKSRLDAIKPT